MLDRDALITAHLWVAERAASMLKRRARGAVGRDELVSIGYLALVEAAARFDESRATTFATFAMYRVRGAILDFLRAWFGGRCRDGEWRATGIQIQDGIAPEQLPIEAQASSVDFWLDVRTILPAREHYLVVMHFRVGLSQSVLAQRLGIGKVRASQLMHSARQRMRAAVPSLLH